MKRLNLPLSEADARELRAGDQVLLSGEILTGRDVAHKRMCELLDGHEHELHHQHHYQRKQSKGDV